METLNKTIYLSDIHNKEEIKEELSNNINIFDKDELAIKNKNMSGKVLEYFNNSLLVDNLISLLKNKKIDTIVYLLYMSDIKKVIKTINTIIEKNNIDVNVIYKHMLYEDDYDPNDENNNLVSEILLK